MKRICLVFVTLLLGACGSQNAKQAGEPADFNKEAKNLYILHHYSLPLDETDAQGAGGEMEASERHVYTTENETKAFIKNVEYGEAGPSDMEEITEHAENIHAEITMVWNDAFVPMYHAYYGDGVSTDDVASELQNLQEKYSELESEVKEIENPEFLSAEYSSSIEGLKSDLNLAISNRSLALIEFKQMNENDENYGGLLDVHIENSIKYLSSAEDHLEKLYELHGEKQMSGTNE
ncbi:hypothetical protein [Salinicoccus albus]|uniref:hypothetical protein n=1 Tax=Salinicoccus albus TaxID=418756 RepID=UPI00035E6475|nr:hypothetical protein [Salinicoccus albus]